MAGFAVGWALLFLLVTAGLQFMPAINIVFGGLLSAVLIMSALYARDAHKASAEIFKEEPGAMAAMTVGLWLAFAGQILKRYSAAPSGADTVFLLSTAPVFGLFVAFAIKERITWGRTVSLLTALVGGAMIVANWERPSSFSPFAIFRSEEVWLLASALGLAMFAAAGRRLTSEYKPGVLLTLALWVAILPTTVFWILSGGLHAMSSLSAGWLQLALIGALALTLPLLCLLEVVKRLPTTRTLTAVSLMPVLITLLIGVEKGFSFAYLPVPFAWVPVLTGIVVVIMGVAAAWLT